MASRRARTDAEAGMKANGYADDGAGLKTGSYTADGAGLKTGSYIRTRMMSERVMM